MIILYRYNYNCLSIYLLRNIYIGLNVWKSWKKLLQTFLCRFLCEHKCLNRHSTKVDIQIANKGIEGCSTLYVISKLQSKTTMWYLPPQSYETLKFKTSPTPNASQDVEQRKFLSIAGGNAKWYIQFVFIHFNKMMPQDIIVLCNNINNVNKINTNFIYPHIYSFHRFSFLSIFLCFCLGFFSFYLNSSL